MLRVKLDKLDLGITFQREYVATSGGVGSTQSYLLRATYCNLHRLTGDGKTDAIIARSFVKADSRTNFNSEEGRKKALTRSLRQLGMLRADRTLVWAAYLGRPRPVSKPKVTDAVKVQPAEEAIRAIMEGSAGPLAEQPQQADGYREPNRAFVGLDLNAGEIH